MFFLWLFILLLLFSDRLYIVYIDSIYGISRYNRFSYAVLDALAMLSGHIFGLEVIYVVPIVFSVFRCVNVLKFERNSYRQRERE